MRSFRLRSFCLFSNQVSRQAVRQFTSRDTTVRGTFRWMAADQERLPVPQGIVKQLFFFKRYFHPALPSDRWIARISSRLQRATIPFFCLPFCLVLCSCFCLTIGSSSVRLAVALLGFWNVFVLFYCGSGECKRWWPEEALHWILG